MKKKVYTDKALIKNRISISLFILFGLIILLAIRLTYIMIVKHDEYSARAQEQWTSEVKISARRGKILDTNFDIVIYLLNNYISIFCLFFGEILPKTTIL